MAFYLSACSCSSCQKSEEAPLPKPIVDKADSYVKAKVGEEFFNKYVRIDYTNSRSDSSVYLIRYRLRMPGKEFVDGDIHFSMDRAGKILIDKDIVGIPDCIDQPETCEFNIDKETAAMTAAKAGMKKGIKNWDIGFRWDDQSGQYVWHIISTLSEIQGTKANGEEILIDPNNGNVIVKREWSINQ